MFWRQDHVITGFIHSSLHCCCSYCLSMPGSGARQLPVLAPSAGGRCWWHLPKRAGKPKARVKALRRRPKQSKTLHWLAARNPKFLPNLNRTYYALSKPRVLVEDQSKCGCPKRKSKPEVRVEAGSQSRISTILSIVNVSFVMTINQYRKSSQQKSYLFRKIEYSCLINWAGFNQQEFWLTQWFESSGTERNNRKLQKKFYLICKVEQSP